MTLEDSAYCALGLRRGASRAAVDDAYRRLMKVHHPDRSGGDGARAAEINRAYTYLRRDLPNDLARARNVPLDLYHARPLRRPRRSLWGFMTVCLVVGIAAVSSGDIQIRTNHAPHRTLTSIWPLTHSETAPASAPAARADFASPIYSAAVANAVAVAEKFHSDADLPAAVDYSRSCQNRLQEEPSLAVFDVCAAFDESFHLLASTDPLWDDGPFNDSAIVTREVTAAQMLSDDVTDVDSRLRLIRTAVELRLVPAIEAIEAAPEPSPTPSQP